MTDPHDEALIHRTVAVYYAGKLADFGAKARGVDWKDEASQRVRHHQFLRLLGDDREASVCDLGCGYGDFLPFLRQHGYRGLYVGCDIAAEMIEAALSLHGTSDDRQWVVGATLEQPVDFVVASGIFNVKQGFSATAWSDYMWNTVDEMACKASKGFGFNVLSLHSDPERRRADLFYADPAAFLDEAARRYGRHLALLQDYGLYEFTLLVRR